MVPPAHAHCTRHRGAHRSHLAPRRPRPKQQREQAAPERVPRRRHPLPSAQQRGEAAVDGAVDVGLAALAQRVVSRSAAVTPQRRAPLLLRTPTATHQLHIAMCVGLMSFRPADARESRSNCDAPWTALHLSRSAPAPPPTRPPAPSRPRTAGLAAARAEAVPAALHAAQAAQAAPHAAAAAAAACPAASRAAAAACQSHAAAARAAASRAAAARASRAAGGASAQRRTAAGAPAAAARPATAAARTWAAREGHTCTPRQQSTRKPRKQRFSQGRAALCSLSDAPERRRVPRRRRAVRRRPRAGRRAVRQRRRRRRRRRNDTRHSRSVRSPSRGSSSALALIVCARDDTAT